MTRLFSRNTKHGKSYISGKEFNVNIDEEYKLVLIYGASSSWSLDTSVLVCCHQAGVEAIGL